MIGKITNLRFVAGIVRQSVFSVFRGISKPRTLQLPITGFCNSKCLTCNVWKGDCKKHIDAEALRVALSDPFFSDIQSVGINGGELTLVPNFSEVVNAVLTLPNVKMLWLISNCLLDTVLLERLEAVKATCAKRCVKLGITISVDGVGPIDNFIRGVPHAFECAEKVLCRLNKDKSAYCDYCDIGCTVSKYNAPYLVEMQCWARKYKSIPVYYHLAVPNKRIGTFSSSDYSVLSDRRATMLAAEFFFSQYQSESESLSRKLQMWANYHYLVDMQHRRMTTCSWERQDVTIDEGLNLYLCATASEKIGNLVGNSATALMKSQVARQVRRQLKRHCLQCIHYSYSLSLRGLFTFGAYYLREELFRGQAYERTMCR